MLTGCDQGSFRSTGGPGENRACDPRLDRQVAEQREEITGLQFVVDVHPDPGLFDHLPPSDVTRPERDVGSDEGVKARRPLVHQHRSQCVASPQSLQSGLKGCRPLGTEYDGVGFKSGLDESGFGSRCREGGPVGDRPFTEAAEGEVEAGSVDNGPQRQCGSPAAQRRRQGKAQLGGIITLVEPQPPWNRRWQFRA